MKTVEELLNEIPRNEEDAKGVRKKTPYSRTRIAELLTSALNDPTYAPVISYNALEQTEVKADDYFTKFRTWVKKLLEQAGMDSADASVVLNPDFKVPKADALLDIFLAVERDALKSGSIIKLPADKEFTPNFYAVPCKKSTRKKVERNIRTGETLGEITTVTDEHYELKVSNRVPKWVKSRLK